jgi:hypothetical protein
LDIIGAGLLPLILAAYHLSEFHPQYKQNTKLTSSTINALKKTISVSPCKFSSANPMHFSIIKVQIRSTTWRENAK